MPKTVELSQSVNEMLGTGKINLKVLRSLLDHISGGDIPGLLAKLVTVEELDIVVETVSAVNVKQESIAEHVSVEQSSPVVTEIIEDPGNDRDGESATGVVDDDPSFSLPRISRIEGAELDIVHQDLATDDPGGRVRTNFLQTLPGTSCMAKSQFLSVLSQYLNVYSHVNVVYTGSLIVYNTRYRSS